MDMPGRKFGVDGRYGFNGKERDKDMHSLTAYDYGFRIYNPTIGKFLSVDPLFESFPWNSQYSYAEGNPVNYIDLDGLETPNRTAQATPVRIRPLVEVEIDKELLNGESGGRIGTIRPGPKYTTPAGIDVPTFEVDGRLYRALTQDEIYSKIGPNGATLSPDGKTVYVYNSNGPAGSFSLIEEVKKPSYIITWANGQVFDIAKATMQLNRKMAALSNYNKWNPKINGYEIITTDPSTLTDEYLIQVRDRVQKGVPTDQDRLYLIELNMRISKGAILPFYENPGTHDPNSIKYVATKSVLPSNHEELFKQSVVGSDGNRWAKVGKGKKAEYHRFFDNGNGTWHWSGSSNGKTKVGTAEIIKENEIPVDIKRLNEKNN